MKRSNLASRIQIVLYMSISIILCLSQFTLAEDSTQGLFENDIDVSVECQPMKYCEVTYHNKSKTKVFTNINCQLTIKTGPFSPQQIFNLAFKDQLLPQTTEVSTISIRLGEQKDAEIDIKIISAKIIE